MNTGQRIPVVVLISGNGSNLQAIIDGFKSSQLPIELKAVISNEPDAYGLERARQADIPTAILPHRNYTDRQTFDLALQQLIDQYQPQLLVLAGFMRILSESFVRHYEGKMLNIHPSLLPKYRGLNTHRRALADGETQHGATVHFVTHELDGGPAIVQAVVPVLPNDTPDVLAKRVLAKEHIIYPLAVCWFAEGRLTLHDNKAVMDGKALDQPICITSNGNNEAH